MATDLTRRTFLKEASIAGIGAAAAGFGLASCSPSSNEQASRQSTSETSNESSANDTSSTKDIWSLEEVGEPTSTKDADVLIIGGGGTGIACAVEAVEKGLKPLIVEQLGSLGGSFIGTEFINCVSTDYQKKSGIPGCEDDSVANIINDHMVYHHWYPNHDLVTKFFDIVPENISWLENHGCEFNFTAGLRGRAVSFKPGDDGKSIGARFIGALASSLDNSDAEIMLNTTARKLLVEDGKATGALVEDEKGNIIQINAKAIMVSTGGYANNDEFLHSVSVVNNTTHTIGMDCRHADGLKMIKDAGGMMGDGINAIMWGGPVIKGAVGADWQTMLTAAGDQPILWVNEEGKRFVREDLWSDDFSGCGLTFRNQHKTFSILSADTLQRLENEGSLIMVFTIAAAGQPMTGITKELEGVDSVHKADTIEELAEEVGLEPAALRQTIDNYNAQCEKATSLDPEDTSADEEFGKRAAYMVPVKEAPYYLLETDAIVYTTCGGALTNEMLEVVMRDGTPIKGLYAGGCDNGTIMGDSYDVKYAGGSATAWAIASGRLAAQNIVEYLA